VIQYSRWLVFFAIPAYRICRQWHIITLFFEECLVAANKDYGISFESVLLILAHYKIIINNNSLRFERYLQSNTNSNELNSRYNVNVS
jgi:hypothetical protein